MLINNAAIQGPIGSLEQNDLGAWEQTIRVNLLSPVALCKGLLPRMTNALDASILNLSGGGATGPRANFSAYASAKAALVRFSETLADEVRSQGITVNCVAPGAMKTAMLGAVLERGAESSGAREFAVAAKVFEEGGASMDRVADLALFLSSPAARGITGKLISALWDHWECWPNHVSGAGTRPIRLCVAPYLWDAIVGALGRQTSGTKPNRASGSALSDAVLSVRRVQRVCGWPIAG